MIWLRVGLNIVSNAVTIHPFKAWLRTNRQTQDWAAAALKLSRLTLHRYFCGVRVMDLETKLAVEMLTGGEVRAIAVCGWELDRHIDTAEAA